jgi:hypothetical protein
MSDYEEKYSYGSWSTEQESVAFIKDLLVKSQLFTIYNEVKGRLLFMKPYQEQIGMRIDMVLSPKPKLCNAGWDRGAIGLECKKSGLKLNHPFAQAEDYSNTVWKLPVGFLFMCEYSFLWPFHKMSGFRASQMAQKKIGTLEYEDAEWGGPTLKFYCGEAKVIKYRFRNDSIEIGNLNFGNQTGSR